jgi:hypothetical protein
MRRAESRRERRSLFVNDQRHIVAAAGCAGAPFGPIAARVKAAVRKVTHWMATYLPRGGKKARARRPYVQR